LTALTPAARLPYVSGVNRRRFLLGSLAGALAAPLAAEAQMAKIARIGFLSPSSASDPGNSRRLGALRQGLRELGYAEGATIQLATLAAELVRLKVDVIVTSSTPAAQAAKQATATIPIVVTFIADPVGSGLAASLARPGGNVTGVSTFARGLVTKRLALLKAVIPGATRIGVLWQADVFGERATRDLVEETKGAGRTLGLELHFVEARTADDVEPAFVRMSKARVDGILVFPGPTLFDARTRVVAHAAKARLPAVYGWREAVDAGGLMSYSANFPDMYRRAAGYVDKILKGAKPGDLPIQEPTKFDLVVNLRTAKSLGLTIPPSLLLQAEQVIE
jgi:putative tryptophan/tyrosine transport system substrate-binding protein